MGIISAPRILIFIKKYSPVRIQVNDFVICAFSFTPVLQSKSQNFSQFSAVLAIPSSDPQITCDLDGDRHLSL